MTDDEEEKLKSTLNDWENWEQIKLRVGDISDDRMDDVLPITGAMAREIRLKMKIF